MLHFLHLRSPSIQCSHRLVHNNAITMNIQTTYYLKYIIYHHCMLKFSMSYFPYSFLPHISSLKVISMETFTVLISTMYKVKLSSYTPCRHIREAEVQLHSLFTSTLRGGEWSPSHPSCFTPTKERWNPLNRGVGGPQSSPAQFSGTFATLQKATISFVMPVRRSIRMEQLGSDKTDFHEI